MYFAYGDDKRFYKVMFVLFLAFFLVLVSVSSCFAAEFKFNLNSTEYTVNFDDYITSFKYFVVYYSDNIWGSSSKYYHYVSVFLSNEPITITPSETDYTVVVAQYKYANNTVCSDKTRRFENIKATLEGLNSSSFSSCGSVGADYLKISNIYFSNCDIEDDSGNLVFSSNAAFKYPSFITTEEELCSGKFDTLKIDAGNFDGYEDTFGLAIFDVTSNALPTRPVKTFLLNGSSNYFISQDLNVYYYIPQSQLGVTFENDKKYMFVLANNETGEMYTSIKFTVGGLTSAEEVKNKQDEQTEAIKEQTETNKNIFERIGEMLSYINPFSENFFVYKLIELLIEAIKSLIIPSDGFLSNFFSDLKNWFSDRLGFLFYPFELILDVLDKILNINFGEPTFNIPDFIEPFTQKKLISATTFRLNDMLKNETWKSIHDIYLVVVDAFIVFGLVNLAKRKYSEVVEK